MAERLEKVVRFVVGTAKVIDFIIKLTNEHPARAYSEVSDSLVTLETFKKAIKKVENLTSTSDGTTAKVESRVGPPSYRIATKVR